MTPILRLYRVGGGFNPHPSGTLVAPRRILHGLPTQRSSHPHSGSLPPLQVTKLPLIGQSMPPPPPYATEGSQYQQHTPGGATVQSLLLNTVVVMDELMGWKNNRDVFSQPCGVNECVDKERFVSSSVCNPTYLHYQLSYSTAIDSLSWQPGENEYIVHEKIYVSLSWPLWYICQQVCGLPFILDETRDIVSHRSCIYRKKGPGKWLTSWEALLFLPIRLTLSSMK